MRPSQSCSRSGSAARPFNRTCETYSSARRGPQERTRPTRRVPPSCSCSCSCEAARGDCQHKTFQRDALDAVAVFGEAGGVPMPPSYPALTECVRVGAAVGAGVSDAHCGVLSSHRTRCFCFALFLGALDALTAALHTVSQMHGKPRGSTAAACGDHRLALGTARGRGSGGERALRAGARAARGRAGARATCQNPIAPAEFTQKVSVPPSQASLQETLACGREAGRGAGMWSRRTPQKKTRIP